MRAWEEVEKMLRAKVQIEVENLYNVKCVKL